MVDIIFQQEQNGGFSGFMSASIPSGNLPNASSVSKHGEGSEGSRSALLQLLQSFE
jgi:hypothetical protein